MRSRPRRTCALLATVITAALIAACGSDDDWSEPHAKPAPIGTLGPGFVDPKNPPPPEGTVTPRSGSWNGVRPSAGYRVVLLSAGADAATKTLVAAVKDWAGREDVSLKTLTATRHEQFVSRIRQSIDMKPDLVVAAGNELVDALALVTANHLDQQFLVLGAELPEPTYNVTAANWPGATVRGEGLPTAYPYDPSTFTHDRATRALNAGVAAILHGITGIVIRIDDGPKSTAPPRS